MSRESAPTVGLASHHLPRGVFLLAALLLGRATGRAVAKTGGVVTHFVAGLRAEALVTGLLTGRVICAVTAFFTGLAAGLTAGLATAFSATVLIALTELAGLAAARVASACTFWLAFSARSTCAAALLFSPIKALMDG